ncbi:MAG: fimbrillin family protein [Bacteroidales bacterium]|nr:fimbrillin family protein [Bacteroidales bacterium]
MKIQLMCMALSAMALVSSCSNDEMTAMSETDAIHFGVTTGAVSRATDVYCNANLPGEFQVWAKYTNGATWSTYIDGDRIVNNNGTWENDNTPRYWPKTGSLDFYALSNDQGCWDWNSGSPVIRDFEVNTDVASQVDLLYAVKGGQTKPTNASTKVILNFRHALSQVVFQAKNINPKVYVEVEGVTICNVAGKGSYTLASASTDGNTSEHSGAGNYETAGRGSWALFQSATSYGVNFPTVALEGDAAASAVSLTNSDETARAYANTMMLLPQSTNAWDPERNARPADSNGTYFLIKCKVWNVSGDRYTPADVAIWEGQDHGAANVAVPVALNWQEGKKYVYTFIFGKGAGYNPNPDDPTPEPVMVPITFDVTVDDFVNADQDVDLSQD